MGGKELTYLLVFVVFNIILFISYRIYESIAREEKLKERIKAAIPKRVHEQTQELFLNKKKNENILERRLNEFLSHRTAISNPLKLKLYHCGIGIDLAKFIIILFVLYALAFSFMLFIIHSEVLNSALIGFGGVTFLLIIVLNQMEKRRRKALLSQLSPALDLILRGIQSGSSLEKTFILVTREIGSPLKDEFIDIVKNIEFGVPYERVMHIAAARVNIPEFYFFTAALVIQRESGGGLSDILETIIAAINKNQELEMKIQSLSAEARASGYLLAFIPVVILMVLYYIRPEHISYLTTHSTGRKILLAAVIMITCGLTTINRMAKIDY